MKMLLSRFIKENHQNCIQFPTCSSPLPGLLQGIPGVFTCAELVNVCLRYTSESFFVFLLEGGQAPDVLMQVPVPLITDEKCRASYGSTLTDNMLCAGYDQGGRDACQVGAAFKVTPSDLKKNKN